ncbi:MAG: NADH-quinone oxidoreductase subunit J, partial [Sphingomonadales bacterium]
YVGAVAVLFLFVVMMLDINFVEMRRGFLQYMPAGVLVGVILLVEILLVVGGLIVAPGTAGVVAAPTPDIAVVDNASSLGHLLYTRYVYLFQAAGMILLIAMIGAIVLTHRSRKGVKKQVIAKQVARRREDTLEIKKVEPGQGI